MTVMITVLCVLVALQTVCLFWAVTRGRLTGPIGFTGPAGLTGRPGRDCACGCEAPEPL